MSDAHYETDESPEPKVRPRKVTLHDAAKEGTVLIRVNGATVAGFCVGDDHLELFNANTNVTGLAACPRGLLKTK